MQQFVDLKTELEEAMSDLVWNFVGILDTENKLHPIPKNIQIQALFEYLAKKRLEPLAKRLQCQYAEAGSTREYPDVVLRGGKLGDKTVAIDIKTTRRTGENRVSGFTLGSYAGYFRYPEQKKPFCTIPYGEFDVHWVVGFIYTWNPDADTLHMVSDVDLLVQEKWKMAGRTTGTGTTTAIGSMKQIDRLKAGRGAFESKEEFLTYWRNYSR